MAIFYVLPPRPALGECLARLLRPYVPGMTLQRDSCVQSVDSLMAEAIAGEEAYVVHREELPDGEDLSVALCAGFGAEPGDQVVHVSFGPTPDEPLIRMWRLEAA